MHEMSPEDELLDEEMRTDAVDRVRGHTYFYTLAVCGLWGPRGWQLRGPWGRWLADWVHLLILNPEGAKDLEGRLN